MKKRLLETFVSDNTILSEDTGTHLGQHFVSYRDLLAKRETD